MSHCSFSASVVERNFHKLYSIIRGSIHLIDGRLMSRKHYPNLLRSRSLGAGRSATVFRGQGWFKTLLNCLTHLKNLAALKIPILKLNFTDGYLNIDLNFADATHVSSFKNLNITFCRFSIRS